MDKVDRRERYCEKLVSTPFWTGFEDKEAETRRKGGGRERRINAINVQLGEIDTGIVQDQGRGRDDTIEICP